MPKPDAEHLADLQLDYVARWHDAPAGAVPHDVEGLAGLVLTQSGFNFLLWHEEDEARREDVDDALIARVKRNIDKLNQQRNDHIEQLDEVVLSQLTAENVNTLPDAPLNTETPGSVIDRLSIAALKIYHMREQTRRTDAGAEHVQKAQEKSARLAEQRADLIVALDQLLDDIYTGRKRLKVYRQFKMYNDPTLNPALYGKE
jgi:hypothetical protein